MSAFRPVVPIGFAVALVALCCGCSRPGEARIERTKKDREPSQIRKELLPLFADYHYNRSANPWGAPNYVTLQPVPRGIASLPLFSDLGTDQEVVMGALEDDTNALIVFTQSGMDKWGIVVHRSETTTALPFMNGQRFILWGRGVFFYVGSTFPD